VPESLKLKFPVSSDLLLKVFDQMEEKKRKRGSKLERTPPRFRIQIQKNAQNSPKPTRPARPFSASVSLGPAAAAAARCSPSRGTPASSRPSSR
jgi:hypothetical protein